MLAFFLFIFSASFTFLIYLRWIAEVNGNRRAKVGMAGVGH